MTEAQFKNQIQRLRVRFGDKNFDAEFIQLIWREVYDMSEQAFVRTVDVFIGTRPTTKPPLLTEFKEARLKEQKQKFEQDLRGATQFLDRKAPEEMKAKLKLVLKGEFGGVENVKEALAVAKYKLNPEQDPDGGAA
jgi:hypothetical protein